MKDIVEDRLWLLARGASRRHEEAIDELTRAEREKRLAWEAYDAHIATRNTPNPQGKEP